MHSYWSHTVRQTDETCVVALAGELDMGVVDELSRILVAELCRPGSTALRVDLAAVEFLDATVLSALIIAYNTARVGGRGFGVVNAHGRALRVLEITGLSALFSRRASPSIGRAGHYGGRRAG